MYSSQGVRKNRDGQGHGNGTKTFASLYFIKKIENDFELSILISREGGSGLTVEFSYSTKYPRNSRYF